jgi:hypothetical protein
MEGNRDQNISCKLDQNNVAENGEAIHSIPYLFWSHDIIDDRNCAVAVVCDSSEWRLVADYY